MTEAAQALLAKRYARRQYLIYQAVVISGLSLPEAGRLARSGHAANLRRSRSVT